MPKQKRKAANRVLIPGRPDYERPDNMVVSARYTIANFLPKAILEQFRRFANLYFLGVGIIMFLGTYTPLFDSAISPWTTLGPLSVVISISLLVEGYSDYKRHLNDAEVNSSKVVVLTNCKSIDGSYDVDEKIYNGRNILVNVNKAYYANNFTSVRGMRQRTMTDPADPSSEMVEICFRKLPRRDIRQGNIVLVKNREMVPADLLLLASSNDQGGAYIETSSIDGETNLKLRNSPRLPARVLQALRDGTSLDRIEEEEEDQQKKLQPEFESLDAAVKRLTRFSALGRPDAKSVIEYTDDRENYVAALTTEPPNASVHTFSGKLTLPPFGHSEIQNIPLGPENVLLRGAVIRNTEWIIGMAFFTGSETKLVQNSFETPSKFSQLDILMNKTVCFVLFLMVLIISYLATGAVVTNTEKFDQLYYIGFNKDTLEPWPHFRNTNSSLATAPVEWQSTTYNWLQYFFLFITLVSNLIPLSMYVTIEIVQFCLLTFINVDVDMYDAKSDTRALARSTIVSDLGRIQYIFSDKTGTLTQNVMRFKRCSVDGMAFGAPIQKARNDDESTPSVFHPLRQLLVGRFKSAVYKNPQEEGLEGLGQATSISPSGSKKLTFHAEMFLRVMSLCHTVVVEKDIEDHISSNVSTTSSASVRSVSSLAKKLFQRKRSSDNFSNLSSPPLDGIDEISEFDGGARERTFSHVLGGKSPDGAPSGYAYQAESPDEGALVSAASNNFDFQVTSRDLNGIVVRVSSPSHLQDAHIVEGLRNNTLRLDRLAAETSADVLDEAAAEPTPSSFLNAEQEPREETWQILAVNKFDSTRKRMSILLRSPEELGSLPILFCKGADSAMLDPEVCEGHGLLQESSSILNQSLDLASVTEDQDDVDEVGYTVAQMLGMQMHLGEFAKEGLRTLVLGMRILSEDECAEWLQVYEAAATDMKDRDSLLAQAAVRIENNLHIVGATAIEDKLQDRVPETISMLEKAGIKLWVLTGDKRETAVEIGYSTHVLTSKMCLTEVPDNGKKHVRTQMAMEFIRLVKSGHLSIYQNDVLQQTKSQASLKQKVHAFLAEWMFISNRYRRKFQRMVLRCMLFVYQTLNIESYAAHKAEQIKRSNKYERSVARTNERRKRVRARADRTIKTWIETKGVERQSTLGSHDDDDLSLASMASEEVPAVFNREKSARTLLNDLRGSGDLSKVEIRELSLALLTAQQKDDGNAGGGDNLVDEDALSLKSFFPESGGDLTGEFDKRKRTLLERLFAVDRQVRKGRLMRHMTNERLEVIRENSGQDAPVPRASSSARPGHGPRALVIEGAALKHLLGEPDFEEILFAVASQCDAVIACRVSPKQKAELVNLVRQKVEPEPITLAIGDGANDVGMIQEAHVGIGISGKEGKQAVNASDFSIAQFRFLETLVLIHGRWNFFRLSTVVLFSFYKNAIMSGVILVFSDRTVYSGTPVFDEWLVSMLNFVAAFPIIFMGVFDRPLSKDYVRAHPEVYRATRENELFTFRTLIRWIGMCLVHVFTLYWFSIPQQSWGGGVTPAFRGLMSNDDPERPGEGEGGDLQSVGTVTYTCMVILLAYKVIFESRSLVHGNWPPASCSKKENEGCSSRLPYTWFGMLILSIGFYFFAIVVYALLGRFGPHQFSNYPDVAFHVMTTRSLSWVLMLFIPICGIVFDIVLKVFSNMFYPTQTQVHVEMEAMDKRARKRLERQARQESTAQRMESFRRRPAPINTGDQTTTGSAKKVRLEV